LIFVWQHRQILNSQAEQEHCCRNQPEGDTPKDSPIQKAAWKYPADSRAEVVLKEIGGFNLATGQPVNGIADLKDDGTTSSGAWIYAGVFKGGKNLTKRRDNKTDPSGLGIYPNFAWTWPGNMHILYKRASCDEHGVPLDPAHKLGPQ
jgi:formate dehydrogenase major subunit